MSARRSTRMSPTAWDGEVPAACGAPGARAPRGRGGRGEGCARLAAHGEEFELLALGPPGDPRLVPLDGGKERAGLDLLHFTERLRILHPVRPQDRAAGGGAGGDDGPHEDVRRARPLGGGFRVPGGEARRQLHPLRGGEEVGPLLRRRRGGDVRRGGGGGRAAAFGAYARRERYLDNVMPREPAATTMEIPNTARCARFRIHSPEGRI